MIGIITKINKDIHTVAVDKKYYECFVRGKIRYNEISPTVGDKVRIDTLKCSIEEILPRTNTLIRPLVSNINKLFIVCSTKTPNFSTYLLDKFLVIAYSHNIKPIIIITKMDLLKTNEKKEIKQYIKYYKSLGYKIYINNAKNKILKQIKNSIVAFTGQTGAGKSTLLNKIDKTLTLKTGEVSTSLGRGRHTTRIVELFEINGGLVADTPGFSSLNLENITKEQIKESYPEFNVLCKYKTCTHQIEEGCLVLKLEKLKTNKNFIYKERYQNYIKLIKEV